MGQNKEVSDYNEFRTGDYYANKAAQHSKNCSPEENERRRENGRRPNVADAVAIVPDVEVLDSDPFRGLDSSGSLGSASN